jgi:hypothetical protein
MSDDPHMLDPMLTGGIDLLRRTGLTALRISYSPDDDGPPVIWHATGTWEAGSEAAAAMTPLVAVMRLCEQVIDGGHCEHCGRGTMFTHDTLDFGPLLPAVTCIWAWDPELKVFRRGCE